MSQTTVTKHYSIRKRNSHNAKGKTLHDIVSLNGEAKNVIEKVKQNLNTTSTPKSKKVITNSQRSTVIGKEYKGKQSTLSAFFVAESEKLKNSQTEISDAENCCASQQKESCEKSKPEFSFKNVVEPEINCLSRSPKRNHPSPPDEGTPSKRKHLETNDISEQEAQTVQKPKENARRKLQLGSLPRNSRTVVHSPNARVVSASSKQIVASSKEEKSAHKPKEAARRKLQLDSHSSKSRTVDSPNTKLVSASPLKSILHAEESEDFLKKAELIIKPKESPQRKLQLDSFLSKSRAVHSPNTKLASASPLKSILHVEESEDFLKKAELIIKPKESPQRKLQLNSLPSKSRAVLHSPSKLVSASPKKTIPRTPDKLDALIDQSRSTLILSPKLDKLKKALQLFSEKTSNRKESLSSPYKTNAVTESPKSIKKTFSLPPVFASEPFKHLDQSDALVLPYKYKILSEMFRSMDALVGTLNNRKEKITFDNVKEGVQKIMKRNFSEKHLGQIMAVLPSAYHLSREKASYISKKNNCDFQLVIAPNISADIDNDKKTATFQTMNPSCLISRANEFNRNLLELVKNHHQDFLTRINFVPVSVDNIKRWHPKFPIDSVPDVPVAQLPESNEMKIYTAKDVLNRFKGSLQNKVGKALQSVADETGKSSVTLELKEVTSSKPEASKNELKGICGDLLEKIRAKESAKLLKTMTQSPAETKMLAMLEHVPKIVNILSFYFISERKSAIPVDAVVDKIIHSFNSLSNPDRVKEHLKLIAEKFPGWLNFIQIPKGVYITMNKKTNINEMLDNAGLH